MADGRVTPERLRSRGCLAKVFEHVRSCGAGHGSAPGCDPVGDRGARYALCERALLLNRAASLHAHGASLRLQIAAQPPVPCPPCMSELQGSSLLHRSMEATLASKQTNNQEAPETGEPTFSGDHHGIRLHVLHAVPTEHDDPSHRATRAGEGQSHEHERVLQSGSVRLVWLVPRRRGCTVGRSAQANG